MTGDAGPMMGDEGSREWDSEEALLVCFVLFSSFLNSPIF